MSDTPLRANLVLGGGGVRGIALVGAVEVLAERGYEFSRVIGTSAGAIVGSFVAALTQSGQPLSRLGEILDTLDYKRLADPGALGHVPFVGESLEVLFGRTVFQGRYLRSFLTDGLASVGVRTFADLRLPVGGIEADAAVGRTGERDYRLAVTVTDLANHREAVIPWDLGDYGLDPDGFPVAEAVAASAAIPFVFPAARPAGTSKPAVWVDGGVLDDVPVATMDSTVARPAKWPTFAVTLSGKVPAGGSQGEGPRGRWRWPRLGRFAGPMPEVIAMVETLLAGGESRHLAAPCTSARTIRIDASGVSPLDFDLSPAQRRHLIDAGRSAAQTFLEGWDFQAWLDGCGARG